MAQTAIEQTEPLRLSLFGGFRVERGETTLGPPTSGRRILAALALLGPMARTYAAGVLWPEVAERRALGSLRTGVWRLRALDPDLIETSDDHLRLGSRVRVDVSIFSRWAMRRVQSDAASGPDAPAPPSGELLPEWNDEWMIFERERLRQLRLHALDALAHRLCAQGRFADAVDAASEAVRLEPLRESAQHTLIAVYLAQDDVAEARRQYTAFSRLLAAELAIAPSARLQALVGCRHE